MHKYAKISLAEKLLSTEWMLFAQAIFLINKIIVEFDFIFALIFSILNEILWKWAYYQLGSMNDNHINSKILSHPQLFACDYLPTS